MKKALRIIQDKKIEYVGSSPLKGTEYYEVCGILITLQEVSTFDVGEARIIYHKKYICTCKSCSITQIPREEEPICCYTLALAMYLKDDEFIDGWHKRKKRRIK